MKKNVVKILSFALLLFLITGCQSKKPDTSSNDPIPSQSEQSSESASESESSSEDEQTVYRITYSLQGGILDAPNPDRYTAETETFTLNNPHKAGYLFLGWASNLFSDIRQVVTVEKGTTGDLIFSAKYEYIGEISYYNGENISLLPSQVKDLLSFTDEGDIAKYLYNYHQNYHTGDDAHGVVINFPNPKKLGSATINLYEDEEHQNLAYTTTWLNSYGLAYGNVAIYNLIPNRTYYIEVLGTDGSLLKEDYFSNNEWLRFIKAGNISNMRDGGGKVTEDGITIPYGKVYRSADMNKAHANSQAIDVLVNQLHIKTEIDLRLDVNGDACDPSINIEHCGYWHNDYIFPNFNPNRPFSQTYADNLRKAFLLFTDSNNYPIDFHCSAGADRTGTFAFLLDGLLGVPYETLAIDYEITSFYMGRRWRSNIVKDGENYYFDDTGVMQDDSDNLVAFGKMYNHMMEAYGTSDHKLSSAIANYLKTVVGLTDANINAIKGEMLDLQ